jgi:hypothetical protein
MASTPALNNQAGLNMKRIPQNALYEDAIVNVNFRNMKSEEPCGIRRVNAMIESRLR